MDHNGSFSEAVQSLTQLDALLQSLSKHSSLKTISAQGINEMKDGVERIRRRIKEQKLTVAVMALTKSGKSTFLNSMLGDNLLPVHNAPCTARICEIAHKDMAADEKPFLTEKAGDNQAGTVVAKGSQEVLQYLAHLNTVARDDMNGNSERKVEITAQFPALMTGVAAANFTIGMSVLDTPGPNEAGADFLKHTVRRLLQDVDAVIYLLDYTKLGTNDEQGIFEDIKKTNASLLKDVSDRIFFVVNKMDSKKFCAGATKEETRGSVAARVTKAMAMPDFTLKAEQVLCVSAHEALLARLSARGLLDDDQRSQLHERTYPVSDPEDIPAEMYKTAAAKLFLGSGMPELEQAVLSYLYSKRAAINLKAVIQDLTELIKRVEEFCSVQTGMLSKSMHELEQTRADMADGLAVAKRNFVAVQKEADGIVSKVTDKVEEEFRRFGAEARESLDQLFQGKVLSSNLFKRAWHRISVFTSPLTSLFGGNPSEEIVKKGPEARAFAEQMRLALQHVDTELTMLVRDLFGDLESKLQAQQQQLFGNINKHLEDLSKSIQAVIEEEVHIKLQDVGRLNLKCQDAEAFHQSMESIVNGCANVRTEDNVRQEDRETQRKVRYWFFWTRTVTELVKVDVHYKEDVLMFNPRKIKDQYTNLVDQLARESIRDTKLVVTALLKSRIDPMEAEMNAICQQCQDHVSVAIAIQTEDESVKQKVMHDLTAALETLQNLSQTFVGLSTRLTMT